MEVATETTLNYGKLDVIRAEQNRLKVAYIEALRRYSNQILAGGALEMDMIDARELLHAFERRMPGNNGEISSVVTSEEDLVKW